MEKGHNLFVVDPSTSQAPQFKGDIAPLRFAGNPAKAVVIGGGSGAPISIRTLIELAFDPSVVVAMADDGGSTGVLREAVGASAPGDVRKCLAAMAAPQCAALAEMFQTRLAFADDHPVGNLIISTLEHVSGSFEEAVAACAAMLCCRGEVIPSTLDAMRLRARLADGSVVEGQRAITKSAARVELLEIQPSCVVRPNPRALEAIAAADIIVLGPGSLFTSVLSCLVVPGIARAIADSGGRRMVICPLADTQGESRGLDASGVLRAYERHGLEGAIDFACINDDAAWDVETIRPVRRDEGVEAFCAAGTRLLVRDYHDEVARTWHKPAVLAQAIGEVAQQCRLLRR